MKKRLFALLLASMMLVSMVACAAPAEPAPEAPAEAPADDGEISTELEVKETVAAAEDVEYKEHIIIGIDAQLTTLDPTQKNNVIQNCLFYSTHDTLITYNNETGEYDPGLATEWEWDDEFMALSIAIRDDVKFHNGEDFTMEDGEITTSSALLLCKKIARLVNDLEGQEWLSYEYGGYPTTKEGYITDESWGLAVRHGRSFYNKDKERRIFTELAAELEESIASILKIHPYRVKLAIEKGYNYSSKTLLSNLDYFFNLDYMIKSGNNNPKLVFELFLANL